MWRLVSESLFCRRLSRLYLAVPWIFSMQVSKATQQQYCMPSCDFRCFQCFYWSWRPPMASPKSTNMMQWKRTRNGTKLTQVYAHATFVRLSRASFMSHLLAPPTCRSGPFPWLALWYGMVSHWLSGSFQEYSPWNSFSNLKQHYSAALGLGALLSNPTLKRRYINVCNEWMNEWMLTIIFRLRVFR